MNRHRALHHAAALAAALVMTGAALTACRPASDGPLAASLQESQMVTGQPFTEPAEVGTVAGSHASITLEAAAANVDVAGRSVWGQAYNGAFVGPTLRFTPGQDVTVDLVNDLAVATNLHFHGLHISPSGNADDSSICVAPGQHFDYHFVVPADHPQGTFWYHSHAMTTMCPDPAKPGTDTAGMDMAGASPDVENQISTRLSGAIIVGDDRTLLPESLRTITGHTFVFKDSQIDHAGRIVQHNINSNNPTVRLVNGQLRPVLRVRPGETQLWRLVNAGADIFYKLRLDGQQFTIVGQDGRAVEQADKVDDLLLPPGKRYDVLVTAPAAPAHTWLRTLPYSNGPQGDRYPNVRLLRLDVTGEPEQSAAAPLDTMAHSRDDLASAQIAQRRTVTFSENSRGTQFFINGQPFAGGSSVFDSPAQLGTVEEWTVVNTSREAHPFHLHTTAFQVMSVNGVPLPYTGRQEIVVVPPAANRDASKVVIRIPFTDYPGRWMFHCHIAAHEDNGMMSFINVVVP